MQWAAQDTPPGLFFLALDCIGCEGTGFGVDSRCDLVTCFARFDPQPTLIKAEEQPAQLVGEQWIVVLVDAQQARSRADEFLGYECVGIGHE